MEILGLAKLAKNKIKAKQCPKSTFVPFRNMVPQRPPIPLAPSATPIKHLSEVEIQTCREKGICYHCDEKLTWGHQCVEKNILLDLASPPTLEICEAIQDPVDDQVEIQQSLVNPPSHDDYPNISLHALSRVTTPKTMRVKGFFKKIPLTILIDSSSTTTSLTLRS